MLQLAARSMTLVAHWVPARWRSSDVARRMLGGAAWSSLGAASSRGLTMISYILVARILGSHGFGEVGIVQNTALMLGSLAGFRMGVTATKFVAELRGRDDIRAERILTLCLIVAGGASVAMSTLLVGAAPWISEWFLGARDLAPLLWYAGPLLVFATAEEVLGGALAGFEAFRVTARAQWLAGVVSLPLFTVSVWVAGTRGMLIALIIARLLVCALYWKAILATMRDQGLQFRPRDCWSEGQVLVRFCLPTVACGLMLGPVTWLGNAWLVRQADGLTQMGHYSAALQWHTVLTMLPTVITNAALPIFSERLAAGDYVVARRLFLRLTAMNALVIVPAAAICLGSRLVMGLYGPQFVAGSSSLIVVVLTMAIMTVEKVGHVVVFAAGKTWRSLAIHLVWAVTFLLTVPALLQAGYGATGLALARMTAYGLQGTLIMALATYILWRRPDRKSRFARMEA